jgi:hypothetical protein
MNGTTSALALVAALACLFAAGGAFRLYGRTRETPLREAALTASFAFAAILLLMLHQAGLF